MKSNIEMLEELDIQVQKIRGNSGKVICPKCSHDRKKKTDPCLSVNISEGLYRCHNCGWAGAVYEKSNFEASKPKEYVRPKFVNNTECSKLVVDFFFKRGISQKTISDLKVTESSEWMPQTQKNETCINFNYFIGEELINTKFRGPKKIFKMVKDAELVFYNLNSIKSEKSVVIVEGEMDALSFHEAGVKNVVSVPNGATLSGNPNMDYLDNCIEHFEGMETIIIATDADDAGIKLREELARRLGYHRCYKVDFIDCKDANDYLQKYGADKLSEVVSNEKIRPFPIAGIVNVSDLSDEVRSIIRSGGLKKGLTLGIKGLDDLISWVSGQLTVVTGIPNHGKSPFVLMIMILLSIQHGWKWAVFSPEHKPISLFLVKIIEMLTGKRSRFGKMSDHEIDVAMEFIKNHFFFIAPEDNNNKLDNIIDKARSLVIRHGVNGMLIDPWNKLEYEYSDGLNETNMVSKQLDKIIEFDQSHGVHTIVIAHPTKGKKKTVSEDSEYVVPDLTDIAGSANWHNKPDNGIVFYRNFGMSRNEVYVKKVKWENLGRQGRTYMKYNVNNDRFSSIDDDFDNTNWLIPNLPQPELFNDSEINNESQDTEEVPF